MNRPTLIALSVIGAIVPYAILIAFIAQHGLDIPLLLQQVFASYGSTFFALDVIISAIVVIALSITNKSLGSKRYYTIAASLLIGPSCSLPLYVLLAQDARAK
ncbi:DUF2834 domain-containing protein [Rhodococcus sp. MALMAid1271]|uniref:DUF2834 domain-containing protein n=1 Tax=Rhodococcus sp. MALMAid1271 TaxID=3411744 RepID=UPI003BA3BA2F